MIYSSFQLNGLQSDFISLWDGCLDRPRLGADKMSTPQELH
jgi:hypothetical protein